MRTIDEINNAAYEGPVVTAVMILIMACPVGFLLGLFIGWAIWG